MKFLFLFLLLNGSCWAADPTPTITPTPILIKCGATRARGALEPTYKPTLNYKYAEYTFSADEKTCVIALYGVETEKAKADFVAAAEPVAVSEATAVAIESAAAAFIRAEKVMPKKIEAAPAESLPKEEEPAAIEAKP